MPSLKSRDFQSVMFLIKQYYTRACRVMELEIHPFILSALERCEWSATHASRFTPKEKVPGASGRGGWFDPNSGLDTLDKRVVLPLPGTEPRFFCRLSRNTGGLSSTRPPGSTS